MHGFNAGSHHPQRARQSHGCFPPLTHQAQPAYRTRLPIAFHASPHPLPNTHLISIAPCPPPPMTCANPLNCPGLAPSPGAPPSAPPKAPAPPNPQPVPLPSAPALFCVFCSREEACLAPPGGGCVLYAGMVVDRMWVGVECTMGFVVYPVAACGWKRPRTVFGQSVCSFW